MNFTLQKRSRRPWRPFRLAILQTLLALFASSPALAGAWTLEPGATQIVSQSEAFESDASFDALGAPADGTYRKASFSLAIEHGLFDGITVGGRAEGRITAISSDGQDGANMGLAEVGVSVRGRIWRNDWTVASAQVGYTNASFQDALTPADHIQPTVGDDASEVDVRALLGHGFQTPWGDGWLNAETAYRLRFNDAVDQARFDLTTGMRPSGASRFIFMAQAFGTHALGNGSRSDYDVWKLSPSIGYEFTPSLTLQIGATQEVAGRNIEEGRSLFTSVWWTF
ncbi:MAG: hypothetical protein AAGF51_06910 [Pseudomonadota bacterium]